MSLVLLEERLMVLDALASALRRRGHIVLATASSPEIAVEATLALRPAVCVVNRSAGDEGALRAVRTLRTQKVRTRVLVLSDSTQARDLQAARAAGADGLVPTSASIEAVSVAVTKVDRGAPVWPEAAPMRAVRHAPPVAQTLTPREWQVLELLAAGVATVGIATALGITVNTARTHVQRVLAKLGVSNRFQAAQLIYASSQVMSGAASSA